MNTRWLEALIVGLCLLLSIGVIVLTKVLEVRGYLRHAPLQLGMTMLLGGLAIPGMILVAWLGESQAWPQLAALAGLIVTTGLVLLRPPVRRWLTAFTTVPPKD